MGGRRDVAIRQASSPFPESDRPNAEERTEQMPRTTTAPQTERPATPGPPSIHIRAVITWIAIFPLVALGFVAIAPFASEWNPVLRAFVLSIVVVPIAVYIVVPQLMRTYGAIRTRLARRER